MDDESERIRVHLIEGWRTVIVDAQVKFGQVINSITERLSTQYAADHNATPVDNKYGWIFGIRYVPPGMDGDRHEQLWIHPEMMHGEFKLKYNVNRGPDENSDQGRLELRVRYFPARLHEIDRDYRIIFTLLHKQVFAQYMKLDHVKPELAVQLTVLELRRKFPDMSPKAANLIWNENDQDISYRNFFPQAVLERNKVKDLRRDVKREYTRIEADGMEASQGKRKDKSQKLTKDFFEAAVMFLQLIKRHLFEFDRECFHVKIGLGWSVKVPVAIGPDDQISHLDAAGAHRRMTDFGQINELTISYPECTLALHVQSKQEPLVLTCESQQELDNLADLIDGYCRGTRTPKQGSILKQYRRELPTLPYEQRNNRV